VLTIVPPTALVETEKVALADPAGTMTLAGTVTGSAPESETTAPPGGAAAVKATVAVTGFPPTTVAVLSEIEERATVIGAVTVSVGEWLLLPLSDAVIVAVPAATAATANVAVAAPAGTMTGVCTVATAGLLLDSEMLTPPVDAAAMRLTVPCTLPPTATLVPFSAIPDTAGLVIVGMVGELDPPH
jgi:hypothetical protein